MDHTKEFFDGYADRWDDVNRYDQPQEVFKRLVTALGIKEGSKVIDLGCGTGIFIPYLLEAVGSSGLIYAVDVSDKMLKRLSQKFRAQNIRPFSLKAEELSKIDDKVDAVLCFSTFPHIDDKRKAVKEISTVLKPMGRFLIAHFSSREEINNFHTGLSEPICLHVLPDESLMRETLNKCGFKIINFIDKPSQYELLAERSDYV